jgi:hypothetical protein
MKRKQRLVDKGEQPQGELPFSIDVKGGEKEQRHGNREKEQDAWRQGERWSQGEHEQEHECYHAISVSINSKGGYC